nr:hypothetical protein [Tanacetum cinerariifolium]
MKEEFPDWFGSQIRQRHVNNDKDPEVSTTSELFALAYGPTWTPISINACVVDGVRYAVHNRDERRITQNNGICSLGPDEEMYYGQLQEILEFNLNDLDNATLHIDGQSTEDDVPPDITDMSADVARSHGGDGGGEDRPLHAVYPAVAWVALLTKEITDTKGPVPIQFELRDKQTVMLLGDHATHWSSYIGEHLQKAYNTNKAAFKVQHWVIDPTTGTYNVEKIRRARPENITASEWDKHIQFWNDPRNIARDAQNRGRAQPLRSTRRSLTPSSWHTLLTGKSFGMRTDEEMRRLEAARTYTDDEINRLARGGKQLGHIPGVGRVLPARATASPNMFSQFESGGASVSGGCEDDEEGADHQDDEDEDEDGDGDT